MHARRFLSAGAIIACGLEAVPGSCTCPAGTVSTLTQPYYPPTADCVEYTIPVPIEFDSVVFNFTQWDDDYALEDFLAVATTRASANLPPLIASTGTEQATYNIAASFCTPKQSSGGEKTVILATHGIGLARAHWCEPFRPSEMAPDRLSNYRLGTLHIGPKSTTLSSTPSHKDILSSFMTVWALANLTSEPGAPQGHHRTLTLWQSLGIHESDQHTDCSSTAAVEYCPVW